MKKIAILAFLAVLFAGSANAQCVGALQSNNNLSDVCSATTTRSNLGVSSSGPRPYIFSFGDGATVTSTGKLGVVVIKNACTIAAWAIELISFDSGTTSTTTFDIWVKSNGIPTVSDTIMGTKPTVSAGSDTGAVTTGISGWTSAGAIAAGSRLVVNMDANNHATLGTFMFWCTES